MLPKLLVLIDEVTKERSLNDDALLIAGLRKQAEVLVVAPCYLRNRLRLRRLRCPVRTYAFSADGYDDAVFSLAQELHATFEPNWVLCLGTSNAQLVAALGVLFLPVVSLVLAPPRNSVAASNLYVIFRHAGGIMLVQGLTNADLGPAAGSLAAREDYRILEQDRADGGHPKRLTFVFRFAKRRDLSACLHREAACAAFKYGEELSAKQRAALRQINTDREVIAKSGVFEPLMADTGPGDRLNGYLCSAAKARPYANMLAGRLTRRPAIGFNPLIYATDAPSFCKHGLEDPLAHFLRFAQPQGRWTHEVLMVNAPSKITVPCRRLPKTAIHLHLHYTEVLPDLLSRLESNRLDGVDLHITTTSAKGASEIEASLAARSHNAHLYVRENLGRDVWPFLDLLQSGTFESYEIVGHLHGKRSLHFAHGDIWRCFLWDHLIGDGRPVLDIVRQGFADDPLLGLVFPEDPHLGGWDDNLPMATDLARRMGIKLPLPLYFEYPMGTMFWARPKALAPLIRLNLRDTDMPREPVPVDGTVLHAIECLLVFVAQQGGFSFKTIYNSASSH